MSDSASGGNRLDRDGLISIPAFLSQEADSGISLMSCSYCEVACETSAMICGQCSGQSCSGQCSSAQCGSCQSCQTTCQKSCQNCEGSACQSSCQSTCQKSCQGCQTACETMTQTVAPSYYISDTGSNSVTVYVNHGSGYSKFRIYVRLSGGSTAVWDKSVSRSSSFSYTVTGLSPNTGYVLNVGYAVSMSDSGVTWCGSTEFTTEKPAVAPWSWTSSNGSATASQTRSAYSAVTGKGKTDDFSYLVWNDMVDKVKEILDALGGSWNGTYASYARTRLSGSGEILTAVKFNSLRENIGNHVATGISPVSRNDIVYGWYFTRLTDRLNQWIDSL